MQVERCFRGAVQKEKRLLASVVSPSFFPKRGAVARAVFSGPRFGVKGRVENKVANGCVRRGNLPNSSGQILKKAPKRCLKSLRSIR